MGRWVLRGVGVTALVLAAVGGWLVTSWGEIRVVDAAQGDTGDASRSMLTSSSSSTSSTVPTTTATTAATATTTTTIATANIPTCQPGDELTAGNPASDWATMVVDNQYRIRPDYVPPDLVDASVAGFGAGDRVREILVPDLRALRDAADANHTPIVLISGYRSYERQADLYEQAVREEGEQGRLTTARPGHSEHQLGTAIDVLDAQSSELQASFASTPTGRWLAQNAYRYGFVLSYPNVPVERSCYGFEPWHLRYVGRDVARQIVESHLAPREWMLAHRG